jgi:hypothetical protein
VKLGPEVAVKGIDQDLEGLLESLVIIPFVDLCRFPSPPLGLQAKAGQIPEGSTQGISEGFRL